MGAQAPTPCAKGSFSASAGQSACTQAPAGSFVGTMGAQAATPCAVGSFSASPGQSACTQAPPGSFVDATGAQAATPCALGTYKPNAGAASCLEAPVDTYVDTVGATAVTPCPAGTSTVGTGSTSASDCIAAAPTITHVTASGRVGATVTIKSTNLSGATKVVFGGKKSGSIVSDTATTLKVKVPSGAKTGKIKVVTPGGTVKSATTFRVT
jgi:hypothetical protein